MCRKNLTPHTVIHPSTILSKELHAIAENDGKHLDMFNKSKDLLRYVIKNGFNDKMAELAEGLTGIEKQFWLNLQQNFEQHKADKLDQFARETDLGEALVRYSKASPCLGKDFFDAYNVLVDSSEEHF